MGSDGNDDVLLTGATGFLGSALLRELLANGRRVLATVRERSNLHRVSEVIGHKNLRLISLQPEALEAEFAKRTIGTIIHAATEYGRENTPIANILDANLILPIRLAELGIKYNSKSFINIDSFFNKFHGSYSNLLNYSLSKMTLLNWLERLSQNISVVNAVLEHMYGPGDSNSKFIESMIQNIAIHQKSSVDITHGHQKRDFIYISDVVSAIIAILNHAEVSSFNFKKIEIGTGNSIQVRDMVNIIAAYSDSSTELRFGAIPYRSDEIMNSHADVRDLNDIGWKAKISPSDGIKMIIDRYKGSNV